jgi:hypothetical protein
MGLLSSCRLSMSACFCACVILVALWLPSGVCVTSSVLVGLVVGGGRTGCSVGEARCFCARLGGILFWVLRSKPSSRRSRRARRSIQDRCPMCV